MPASSWLLTGLLVALLFAASAPSPMYQLYADIYGFDAVTLTSIYAVYAFGALGALLLGGRLSDHLGRRPVVVFALVVQLAGMAAFIAAQGVEGLFAGRALQGIGTGIATAAVGAWLLDLSPPTRAGQASLVSALAPMAGLAAGALGASVLIEFGPDPMHLVFWLLAAVYLLSLAAVGRVPDPVSRSPGWLASVRPVIGVPASARPLFLATAPTLVAAWAIGALYLALGPSLAALLLATENRVAGGLVIVALLGTGVLASAITRFAPPRRLLLAGSLALAGGVALTLVAVAVVSPTLLYAGSVVAGAGLGPAFSGITRSLGPIAPPAQRGSLFAAIFVVLYLSLSLPAIAAGLAVTALGLRETTYLYGIGVIILAMSTAVAVALGPSPTASAAKAGRGL